MSEAVPFPDGAAAGRAAPAARRRARRRAMLAGNATVSRHLSGLLMVGAFVWPLMLWSVVSYVPFVWHPDILITDPGDVDYFQPDMLIDRVTFAREQAAMRAAHQSVPKGERANPVYLPTPLDVARAFFAAVRPGATNAEGEWLPSSFWHSVQTIFWGFVISSAIGVPLGILCGATVLAARLIEPFVEFFRYLPAPAFGALCVAILGIYDAPKIAIIVIGTFFQQVLVIANTTRKLDFSLVEAAMTLGTRGLGLLTRVIIPGILPDLYRDQRVLLGWAWTYLIVAELIGTTSGITWFITLQARYQHFANVYAAIAMIGLAGIGTDLVLAALARRLFPWERAARA